jgi:hypothetical protein
MLPLAYRQSTNRSAFTIIEVMAAALLVFLGLGAIFAINTQSLEILRSTRLLANGSQLLQERMESLRSNPWPQVADAQALSQLYATPAPSEAELSTANLVENVVVSIPVVPGTPKPSNASFSLRRKNGVVQVVQPGDLRAQPLLLVDMTLTWQDRGQTKQRELKTIIGRAGLTRSGIFGSVFGRPPTGNPTPPAP